MKTAFLALAALAALPTLAHADQNGMDFSFALRGQYFTLDLDMYFDPSQGIADVRKVFKDTGLFPQFSDLVTRVSQNGDDSSYSLSVSAKKFGITQTNVTWCRDTDTDSSWHQDCSLALGQGNTSRYWVSGRNSIHCDTIGGGSQVMCRLHSEGQPKGISIPLIITRTPEQLALAGAGQSIRDYGVLMEYVNQGLSPSQAQSAYSGSTLSGLQDRLYNEGRSRSDDGALGGSRLVITGSGRSGAFSIYTQ